MPHGTLTFTIERRPAEVFAFVSDMANAPRWIPEVVSVEKRTPGAVGLGTAYDQLMRLGGQELASSMTVTEYDPPRAYAHEGGGSTGRFRARFVFEPEGDGTRVTHEYEVTLLGAMKMLSPVVSSWVKHNSKAAIERLRGELEVHGG